MYNGNEFLGLPFVLILKCKNWSIVKKLISVSKCHMNLDYDKSVCSPTENLCCDVWFCGFFGVVLFCFAEGATCLSHICKKSQARQKFLARGENVSLEFASNLSLY